MMIWAGEFDRSPAHNPEISISQSSFYYIVTFERQIRDNIDSILTLNLYIMAKKSLQELSISELSKILDEFGKKQVVFQPL